MMYICGGNIEHMNKYLSAENKTSMFCTFFLGVLDLKTHLLSYCNAGSELPFSSTTKSVWFLWSIIWR